jgi:hypothetical protein
MITIIIIGIINNNGVFEPISDISTCSTIHNLARGQRIRLVPNVPSARLTSDPCC